MSYTELRQRLSVVNDFQCQRIGAYILVTLVSAATAFILIKSESLIATSAFVVALAVVFLTLYRVDWGFYIFFGMVLLFDQFYPFQLDPITSRVHYFWNLKQLPYLPHFSAGVMNPLGLQLLLLFMSWLLSVSTRRQNRLQHVFNWGIALIFLLSVAGWLGYGLHEGGIFLRALWEIRALFYFGFLFFLVPQIIQTKKQIKNIVWIAIIIMTIKALQGIQNYASLGFTFGNYTCLTNQEDPVFMNVRRTTMIWLMLPMVMGYMTGQRRAAFAGFFVSLFALFILLPGDKRRKLLKPLLPLLGVFAIYCAVFWNDAGGRLGLPVQMIKSGIFENSRSESGARYDSNLYRLEEEYDIAQTIRTKPIQGIGFGVKYDQPIHLPPIPFPLRAWIPHNEILWVMLKMGSAGFFIFWLFMDLLIFRGVMVFQEIDDPYLKAVCAAVIVAVINQMVVSYFDLQLTFYRNMVFLGTMVGLLPTISAIGKARKKENSRKDSLHFEEPEFVDQQGVE